MLPINTSQEVGNNPLPSYAMREEDELAGETANHQMGAPKLQQYSDVLPSFEMHHFMFNNTLSDVNNKLLQPPSYEDNYDTPSVTTVSELSSVSGTLYDPTVNTFESPTDLLLNNLEKLQKINLPVEVKVTLTKEMMHKNMTPKPQSSMKIYLPGETIHGYVTIENKSHVNIPFEKLLVSMECNMGTRDDKCKNIFQKELFKIYDLEASYHLPNGPSNKLEFDEHFAEFDSVSTCLEARILKPGKIYVRQFRFRMPNYVLDNNCKDQFVEHLRTPPSFGVNRFAFNSVASSINIEKHLGYGRLNAHGSPILLNDYFQPWNFCEYFINVQIIGKKLDFYKQYYTPNTSHQYDYIFIKNSKHYFLVGKSQESIDEKVNYGSTESQLLQLENLAKEEVGILNERKFLQQINIDNIRDQNEIIYGSTGKRKTAFDFSTDLSENEIKKQVQSNYYEKCVKLEAKKDFFSKVNGLLNLKCSVIKDATTERIFPKLVENRTVNLWNDKEYMRKNCPKVKLELEFKPREPEMNSKLPRSLSIKPELIAIDMSSAHSIPFIMDNDFIFNNNGREIQQYFKRFPLYYNQIKDLLQENSLTTERATYELLKGIATFKYVETRIPKIFKNLTIDLEGKWVCDSDTGTYKCEIEEVLEYDLEGLTAAPKALIPTFQSCILSRLYKVDITAAYKKEKSEAMGFPLIVV